jgi:hypothetical protein
VGGQLPSALGSTQAGFGVRRTGGRAGGRAGGAAGVLTGSGVLRGTGGKGNGADDHSTPRARSGARELQARQAAYATPPTIPAPSARFTLLRIGPAYCPHPAGILSCASRSLPTKGLTDADDTGRLARLMRKETMAFAALLGLLLM